MLTILPIAIICLFAYNAQMANLIRVTILVDKAKKKELKMEALRNDLSLSRFLIMCADLVLKCPDCVKKLQEKPEEKKQE